MRAGSLREKPLAAGACDAAPGGAACLRGTRGGVARGRARRAWACSVLSAALRQAPRPRPPSASHPESAAGPPVGVCGPQPRRACCMEPGPAARSENGIKKCVVFRDVLLAPISQTSYKCIRRGYRSRLTLVLVATLKTGHSSALVKGLVSAY